MTKLRTIEKFLSLGLFALMGIGGALIIGDVISVDFSASQVFGFVVLLFLIVWFNLFPRLSKDGESPVEESS